VKSLVAMILEGPLFCALLCSWPVWLNKYNILMQNCWTSSFFVGFWLSGYYLCPWNYDILSYIGVIIDVIFWCMDVFSCDRMHVVYYGDINSLMLYYILSHCWSCEP
jgi:hypothetical protein